MEAKLSQRLSENQKMLDKLLHVKENFDLIERTFMIADKQACFYVIDGLNKDEILEKIMESFLKLKPEDVPAQAQQFSEFLVPYGEVDVLKDLPQIVPMLLSGVPVLLVDGYAEAIAVDFRTYPARGIEEPDKDKVLRGSKDGFVETIVFNTAMIRRRIRHPDLIMEITAVGKSSHTDVVISYMKDRVDEKFLAKIRRLLSEIKVDALTMNTESLAETLYRGNWINPFPKFKYTERPDTAASAILEGSIVLLVDNSPSAMVLPTTLFEITEEADDYYLPPVTGTYLRLSRLAINIAALLLTPTWLLFLKYPEWLPPALEFTKITDTINVPILVQLLLLEFAIDGMKLAALNTPSMLSTPLSVIAGIVLGDFTVKSGWFNSETMLYMAFVAIANYSQASYELGYALKFLRVILLLATGVLGVWGYAGGLIFAFLTMLLTRTLSNESYLYPLIPFNGRELFRRLFRISLPKAVQDNKK